MKRHRKVYQSKGSRMVLFTTKRGCTKKRKQRKTGLERNSHKNNAKCDLNGRRLLCSSALFGFMEKKRMEVHVNSDGEVLTRSM